MTYWYNQRYNRLVKCSKYQRESYLSTPPAGTNRLNNQAVLEHGDNVQLDFYFFEDIVRVTKSAEATSYWVNFLCRIEFCL